MFDCSIAGAGSTVWTGSAFDCTSSNNDITLLHSRFNESKYLLEAPSCNGGDIWVQNISVNEHIYTSKISVNVSTHLFETNIRCLYDDGLNVTIIKNFTIDGILGVSINATSEKGKYNMNDCVYFYLI